MSIQQPPSGTPGPSAPIKAPRRRFAVGRTRIGGWWVALIAGTLVLLLLLIFVLQNGQSVQISLFGWHGMVPLGVAMLLAAIAGILAVAIPGTGRIMQLRRAAQQRADPSTAAPAPPASQSVVPTEATTPPTRSPADKNPPEPKP